MYAVTAALAAAAAATATSEVVHSEEEEAWDDDCGILLLVLELVFSFCGGGNGKKCGGNDRHVEANLDGPREKKLLDHPHFMDLPF